MRLHSDSLDKKEEESDQDQDVTVTLPKLDVHGLLAESALYYLTRIDEIAQDDYVAKEEHILNLRVSFSIAEEEKRLRA